MKVAAADFGPDIVKSFEATFGKQKMEVPESLVLSLIEFLPTYSPPFPRHNESS